MDIILRKMIEEDIPEVVAIDQASFSLPWPERSFRFEVTENMASRCWVAVSDNKVVAMLVLWLLVDQAHVATLATHPQFRRMGIARQLLAEALSEAKKEGASAAVLEVRETNEAAKAMYDSFGFVVGGRREKYYKDNNEDAFLMSANL